MVNEKSNGTLDRNNSSLSLSAEEIDKYEFIKALAGIINKFGLKTFFYLPDTANTKMI